MRYGRMPDASTMVGNTGAAQRRLRPIGGNPLHDSLCAATRYRSAGTPPVNPSFAVRAFDCGAVLGRISR